jgi:tetratricopeptide (TPR) repeat protein
MKNTRAGMLFIFFLLLAWAAPGIAQTPSPEQTLKQYLSELQKNANDYGLREKIIRHVQSMRPAPAIPEETRKYMVRGRAAFASAKQVSDYQESVEEFNKAALIAPWVGDVYYNLGIAQEKAGLLASAVQSFKLYLVASPTAPDAPKVRDLIYEIEYRAEKAGKKEEEAARAKAAEQRRRDEGKLAKLRSLESWSGIWEDQGGTMRWRLSIQGNNINITYHDNYNYKYKTWGSNHSCPWGWRGTVSENLDLSLVVYRADYCSYTPRPPTMSWPVTAKIIFDERKIDIKGRDWDFKGQWYESNTILTPSR